MILPPWVVENWFTLLQSLGIVGSLLFTAFSLRADTKTRRVDNLFVINESHRELWSRFSEHPELKRVLDPKADLNRHGVSREEEIFVNAVLFHLGGVFYAQEMGLVLNMDGLRSDVRWFLSLPIPKQVWEKTRILQNRDFVAFVEGCKIG